MPMFDSLDLVEWELSVEVELVRAFPSIWDEPHEPVSVEQEEKTQRFNHAA